MPGAVLHDLHLFTPLLLRTVLWCRYLYYYPILQLGKPRQTVTQFAPGCVSLPAWQLWLEQVVAAPFWLGTCSPVHPTLPGPVYSGSLPSSPRPGSLGLGAVKMSDRSKAAVCAPSRLSLIYPSLPCCPWPPRAHLGQADPTPLLFCVRICAGSLVSVQTSSGRCYVRISGMN